MAVKGGASLAIAFISHATVMGVGYSYNQAPPGSHIITIEGSGDCSGESCRPRKWDPLVPQPAQASAWSAQRWMDFVNQMGALVRKYKPDGLLVFVMLILLIGTMAGIYLPLITSSGGGRGPQSFIYLGAIAIPVVFVGLGGALKTANQKVDAQIEQLCRSFSDGSVTVHFNTQFTGLCKPKHSRTVREVYITAASAGVAAVGQPMAQPMAQMMQVTCPAGSKAGDSVQISTPAGAMQVIIPQGVSAGQTFSVQVAAPQPVVAVVDAVAVDVASPV